MKRLLNRSAVRRLALDLANARLQRQNRPPKFWRVSPSFFSGLESAVRQLVGKHAEHHQQRGKTLRGGLL